MTIDINEDVNGVPSENERIEYLEDGVGPNFRVAIAPNGFIWFSVGVDLISTQGYCDASVARAMARMLSNAADEHDRIMEEIKAQELLKKATNVIDLGQYQKVQEDAFGTEDAVAVEVAREHDESVDDAVVAAENKFD